ncbi:putative ATP-grasp superfamily ATP-dependent carboligase [Saccharothrix coeruleofusca]|uniref:proteasome assembly chaperone family protein n=1 Tax=Saccharothrix coeruleofusca TaxID=33919 RepID=UPI001AE1F416|nr:PAC2 family protein [Saccharothrix coeruleofusca]MBP2337925.1 putative ATP-grasp superfamily ATP-dependent carboligase [Saccharothrix coeruleofusca]
MALDPEELFEVDSDVPDLTGAVLLHHFAGFMDAGAAGGALVEHLLEAHESRVIARFDVDDLIDYRARRPAMTFVTDRWEDYAAPELLVHLLHDAVGTPFLLLTGPEPDRRWEAVAAAVRALIDRWGVRLAVGFHGIPMGVPHTRKLSVISHATRPELVTGTSPFNRVQVPGHLSALLELRLGQWGHDAMGLVAYVPHYLAQSSYPTASLSLLEALAKSTGLVLQAAALNEAARRTDADIARQVAESQEVAQVVEALERQYDAFAEAAEDSTNNLLLEEGEPLPSADELAAELERFLAEQQRD